MTRLIDADALKSEMLSCAPIIIGDFYKILEKIDEQPTIEPERPRGEWIRKDGKIYCSVCGESICDFIPNPKDAVGLILSNKFCPKCGASMVIEW